MPRFRGILVLMCYRHFLCHYPLTTLHAQCVVAGWYIGYSVFKCIVSFVNGPAQHQLAGNPAVDVYKVECGIVRCIEEALYDQLVASRIGVRRQQLLPVVIGAAE